MKKKIIALIPLLAGTSFSIPLINIDLNVGAMNHQPSGQVEYPAGSGNKLDLKDDLGIKGSTQPFARAKVELGIFGLYAQYMPMNFKGNKTISTTLNYGGTTFDANQTIDTKVKLDRYDVAVLLNVPLLGTLTAGLIDLEAGLNARFINYDGSVTGKVTIGSTTQTRTESAKGSTVIPLVYLGGALNFGMVSVLAEVRGISYQKTNYYDLTGELRISPFSLPGLARFYAGLGYRIEKLELKETFDTNLNVQVSSPYLNVGVAF